jgi:hypothetical protein
MQEGVTVQTDEFSGETRIFGKLVLYEWMSYSHTLTVAKHVESGQYYGYFTGYFPEWYFLDTIGVKINDTNPIYYESNEYQRDVISGDLLKEVVFFDLTRTLIENVANAESVQIEVSGKRKTMFELKEENFETLETFLEKTN